MVEWPTVLLIAACYGLWAVLVFGVIEVHPLLWIISVGLLSTLYWSLVHEAVHGHPTRHDWVNQALLFLPIGWAYPYGRFRCLHLDHHQTGELTDPFDDPESWYLTQSSWNTLSRASQALLHANNTLAGRMLIGPLIGFSRFMRSELRLLFLGVTDSGVMASADRRREAVTDWTKHLLSVAVLLGLLWQFSNVPAWQFVAAAYLGISVLLIRTFVEHQAAEDQSERTVIIEDRGVLAFLFLYNNLHVAHHLRPGIAWYRLPGFYRRHREKLIRRNNGYLYPSYFSLFRKYLFVPKEPVAHPVAHGTTD